MQTEFKIRRLEKALKNTLEKSNSYSNELEQLLLTFTSDVQINQDTLDQYKKILITSADVLSKCVRNNRQIEHSIKNFNYSLEQSFKALAILKQEKGM